MSRSSSDFEIHVEETAEAAGLRMAEKRFKDRNAARDLAVQDWELTLLIDGAERGYDDPEGDETRDAVEIASLAHLQRLIAEEEAAKLTEQKRLEEVAADALRKKNEAKERRDRAEFERLRAKFS